ncbi:hypothetical protein C8R46DRAFT_1115887 [Mycena filopes]|nr:hypothetical protein C8R46DRAFT_1115887 [Mycena filopes]
MAFSALAAIVRTAGICTVAVLPAYRPWSSGLFIGVWSALGCFDTGANFLARASEPTPASGGVAIRVAARASLGVALSII